MEFAFFTISECSHCTVLYTYRHSSGPTSPLPSQSKFVLYPQDWTHQSPPCMHLASTSLERVVVQFLCQKILMHLFCSHCRTHCFGFTTVFKLVFEEYCTAQSQSQTTASYLPENFFPFFALRASGTLVSLLFISALLTLPFPSVFEVSYGFQPKRVFSLQKELPLRFSLIPFHRVPPPFSTSFPPEHKDAKLKAFLGSPHAKTAVQLLSFAVLNTPFFLVARTSSLSSFLDHSSHENAVFCRLFSFSPGRRLHAPQAGPVISRCHKRILTTSTVLLLRERNGPPN